jgi:hypothetical protein
MSKTTPHQCQCPHCVQEADHPDKVLHSQINLLLSRLDEQQRRWFVAVESNRHPCPTDSQLSQITGMDAKTIRRGREELAERLEGRPTDAVRLPGGGRPFTEKKSQRS